jgi:exosortase
MSSPLNQPLASGATRSSNILKVWLPIALFAVLWADLVRQLSYTWEANEQYAYGWFVPFLALALFWRRWLDRPVPSQPSAFSARSRFFGVQLSPFTFSWPVKCPPTSLGLLSAFCFLLCLLLLPLRVIYEINPDWPLCSWLMTLTVVGISLYAVFLAGGWKWVRHFAFPVCFILVAVQWPYRIEHGLTQGLMRVVAGLTVELLGWFNIPAFQHGNLIELSTGVVGIDEACSGIRSFQSTLMAALFLGELNRLRLLPRATLILCGLALGFCFNIVRTLLLSWQANAHGISAIDKWHDPAGMTIAVACFFALWAIAVLFQSKWRVAPDLLAAQKLERGGRPPTSGTDPQPPVAPKQSEGGSAFSHLSRQSKAKADQPLAFSLQPCRTFLLAVGCWAILCLGATEVWYRSHEIKDVGVFHWSVTLPETNPTFQKIELAPRTLKLLAFDAGSTSQWNEDDGSEFSLSFFRWNPRSIQSVIQSRIHRPEDCLPASGYRQLTASELVFFDAGQLKLPFRKYTYASEGQILYVFFCQWEDGAETQTGMGASGQTERLRTVWVGRRLVGQQTLEIIVTGSPSLAEAETLVRRRLPELIQPDAAQAQPKRVSERTP